MGALHCAQRGCVSPHVDGTPIPELCPVCRNPLLAGALRDGTAPAPAAKRSRSRAPGTKGSAKAPASSYGGTD